MVHMYNMPCLYVCMLWSVCTCVFVSECVWHMVCKSLYAQSVVWICLGAFVCRQHHVCICLGIYVLPIHEPVTSLKDWHRRHVTMYLYLCRNLHRPMGRLGWLCVSALSLKHVKHVYSGFCVCSHETPGMPLYPKH